ncbi:MAG TPA: hypothetical protein VK487_07125 [Candidatus Bathyarchaeia archaeon]|nr:hypothetical protein [Candidatus Bathyarchaeia archaeon]
MLTNEDRELQIELTKLQIEHANTTSTNTIALSVIFSVMASIFVVYVPLGVTTHNSLYTYVGAMLVVGLLIPALYILGVMRRSEERLEEQIRGLKKKYLW